MFVLNGREERVMNLLQRFNLEEYDSKAYFTLLVFGKLRAGVIAYRSGVPQSKVYETLYRLADKGLVSIVSSSPKEFEAIGIDYLLKSFVKSRRFQIYKAERSYEELKRVVESIREVATNPLVMPIKIFKPRHRRQTEAVEMQKGGS